MGRKRSQLSLAPLVEKKFSGTFVVDLLDIFHLIYDSILECIIVAFFWAAPLLLHFRALPCHGHLFSLAVADAQYCAATKQMFVRGFEDVR